MSTPNLTALEEETLGKVRCGFSVARNFRRSERGALKRLEAKGLVRRSKGAFNEDEWFPVSKADPEAKPGYMQGRGAA
jgi:hypothetical protein